jgi:RNA polymerase sigma-70 factor (ECF subfamily)
MRPDPPDSRADVELLALIARGDAAAFGAFFRRHHGDVYRFALHMTASRAVADDVTQDAFMAVMRDAGRYEAGRAAVTAWLGGIARNFVRRRLERDRPFQPLDEGSDVEQLIDGEADPLDDLTRAERVDSVRRAVLSLPLPYREAVVLCDLQELTYADAAEALGCAVGTVRSRLHRGRALLASKLAPRIAPAPETRRAERDDGAPPLERADRAPADHPRENRSRALELPATSTARNLA